MGLFNIFRFLYVAKYVLNAKTSSHYNKKPEATFLISLALTYLHSLVHFYFFFARVLFG